MSKVPFKDLRFLVKAAVFVGFYLAWIMFEELVIDRTGLWRFMPLYKVGLFCVWDVFALVILGSGLVWFSLSPRSERTTCVLRRSLRWCPACA